MTKTQAIQNTIPQFDTRYAYLAMYEGGEVVFESYLMKTADAEAAAIRVNNDPGERAYAVVRYQPC
jgi:hypothetical protein